MTTVSMQAMVLDKPGAPLELKTLPVPVPAAGQVLLRWPPAEFAEQICIYLTVICPGQHFQLSLVMK